MKVYFKEIKFPGQVDFTNPTKNPNPVLDFSKEECVCIYRAFWIHTLSVFLMENMMSLIWGRLWSSRILA